MKKLVVPVEQLSEETRQLSDVLNNESDLACVVIGAAFLDAAMASLLSRRFIESSVTNKILAPNGLIGGFNQRADLAYCLELIKKTHYQDICRIAEIRNRFAHHHLQLSFRDSYVQKLCEGLDQWRVLLTGSEVDDPTVITEDELRMRARNQFNISVILLANRLLVNALSLKRSPPNTPLQPTAEKRGG